MEGEFKQLKPIKIWSATSLKFAKATTIIAAKWSSNEFIELTHFNPTIPSWILEEFDDQNYEEELKVLVFRESCAVSFWVLPFDGTAHSKCVVGLNGI